MEKPNFRFWDLGICEPDDEPTHEDYVELLSAHTVSDALEEYAEGDSDGLSDGGYDEPGQEFIVELDGVKSKWNVYVEMEPHFHAFSPREKGG